MIISRN